MFPLYPPENIGKPKIFCFHEDQKGALEEMGSENVIIKGNFS